MKHLHFLAFALCWLVWGHLLKAQSIDHYSSLDPSQPIEFKGNCLRYADKEIILGPKTFFVDGQLSDREVADNPYVFNSFNKAAANFSAGTEAEPMKVYLAPYVYWIDDPDDPAIRVGKDGREPFGLVVKCPYLHIIGLNSHPENTVLASSRGQTQGAVGNFTMFDFWGDGLLVKDLTMGNFCNVDLEYPLKKELSRKKRMSAITQAHVAYCHGDKIVADNVHFISRLNMNPLNGAKRILFNKCHMESTDDALTGTGVYLDCTLHFYGQKPFWRSDMGGAVFLNCDFYVCHEEDRQYFCKSVGPLSIVDCRYHSKKPVYAGWTHDPTGWLRCYQYNVKLNGQPYVIGADKPYNTVCMDQLNQLRAFRLEEHGEVLYNTYNLLRGEDDWDPLQVKDRVIAIGKRDGKDYTRMPSCLSVEPLTASIQTGGRTVRLTATVKRHCNYVLNNVPVKWKVQQGYEKNVKLSTSEGYECVVEATNVEDETKHFTVIAYTEDGLECATELTVAPDYVSAPSFTENPKLNITKGVATVSYASDLKGAVSNVSIFEDITEEDAIENNKKVPSINIRPAKVGPLCFREIYYCGVTPYYFRDQTYEIYNNGDEVFYLDSLCFAQLEPNVATATLPVWPDEDGVDNYVYGIVVWQISGSGKDYPLQPGESFLIVQEARDHRVNNASSFDNSMAEWEAWSGNAGRDNPEVPNIAYVFWDKPNTMQWLTSVFGAAFCIYKVDTPFDPNNWQTQVNKTQRFMKIAAGDVMDGVELLPNMFSFDMKRIPGFVDAGGTSVGATYCGKSVCRKVTGYREDGTPLYQDTNNSTDDFEVMDQPMIRRNGEKVPAWSPALNN